MPWTGPVKVDGRPWPVFDGKTVWIPSGPHSIEPGAADTAAHMTDFNGSLQSASATPRGLEFSYRSSSRALARLDRAPQRMEIDGAAAKPEFIDATLVLPRGQHIVSLEF